MTNCVIYPGTFDPITHAHVDLVERARELFSKVIVGVASSKVKSPMFQFTQRVEWVDQVLSSDHNVEVKRFDGLLVDFAKQQEVNVVIRGLRTMSDFEYEFQLAGMNRHLYHQFETVFLMPSEKYMYISSSLVREIARLGGDISPFVPELVASAISKISSR